MNCFASSGTVYITPSVPPSIELPVVPIVPNSDSTETLAMCAVSTTFLVSTDSCFCAAFASLSASSLSSRTFCSFFLISSFLDSFFL